MKIRLLVCSLIYLAGSFCYGQNYTNGSITASGSTCATAGACVVAQLQQNSGGATITLSGTWSATVQFEAAADGVNFSALSMTPVGGGSAVTSATGNGVWQVNIAGLSVVRARASARASGTAVVNIQGSTASARTNGGGGGGGSGTVTEVDTTAPLSGGPITASGSIACATCAIGPGSSTANHIAEFASTDGVTLKDGGAASNGISGQASGVIPLGSTATTIGAQSHCDDGVTTSATVTCTEPITSTGGGSFGGSGPTTFSAGIQIEGGSTLATSNQNGTNYILMDTGSTPVSMTLTHATGLPGAGIVSASVTATQLAAQYSKGSCLFALGDGTNAIPAATYPASGAILNCPDNRGVTWTVTGIHCFTDNAGSSTMNVSNNAGTSLLTGAVTCNATKTSGGAAGTQSATTTIATTDGINFVFVADGTTKYVTAIVDFTY